MTQANNFKMAFIIKIQELYFIENEIERALPKMAHAANNVDLEEGFEKHLKETALHISRLEEIFKILGENATKQPVDGIVGIISDAHKTLEEFDMGNIKDMMLASSARAVEHYEMSMYLCAIDQATALNLTDIVGLLTTNLEEEEVTDEKLSMLMKDNLESIPEDGWM